jgi:hypothetical protein
MPETPDFEKLARRIALYFSPAPNGDALGPHAALRLVWNARGAADLATLEATVPDTISFMPGGS